MPLSEKRPASGMGKTGRLPPKGSPVVSVIICTYNRSDRLRKTLESFLQLIVPADLSWELIVVDNNSADDTRQVIESFAKTSGLPVRYLFQGHQGLAYARNLGVQEARGDILAFTDDDLTVDTQWLSRLTVPFETDGCIGVAGKIVPVWTCEKPAWLDANGPYQFMKVIPSFDLGDERCEIKTPPFGANMAFRRSAFEKYGLFRTDLGRSGGDTEFGRRLIRAQERLLYAPEAVVYHPVERHRTEKRYFQSWYFGYGRCRVRENGGLDPGVGIDRFGHLLWGLGSGFGKWALSTNPHRRFYYKLQLYQIAGEFIESLQFPGSGGYK